MGTYNGTTLDELERLLGQGTTRTIKRRLGDHPHKEPTVHVVFSQAAVEKMRELVDELRKSPRPVWFDEVTSFPQEEKS